MERGWGGMVQVEWDMVMPCLMKMKLFNNDDFFKMQNGSSTDILVHMETTILHVVV